MLTYPYLLAAFNRKLEPRLMVGEGASGVMGLRVPADAATACCAHLLEHWREGRLPLRGGATACFGYATYGKTLSDHDASLQAMHTLLMTNPLLPLLRDELPGFAEMEAYLVSWLHSTCGRCGEMRGDVRRWDVWPAGLPCLAGTASLCSQRVAGTASSSSSTSRTGCGSRPRRSSRPASTCTR